MRARVAAILLASPSAPLCSGCGASSGSSDRGGAVATEAGTEVPPNGAALDGATTNLDAGVTGTTIPASADDASSANSATDAAVSADGSSMGGLQPFKGVANSACADLTTLKVSWWYNWTTSPSGCASPPFVPMVWGHTGKEQSASGIAAEISAAVNAGYDTVLGFNEPDNTGQSNLSVATAIGLWSSFNHASVRLGSPATQGNGTGLTWIQSFMKQIDADAGSALRVDFIATHWYGWNAGSCDAKATNLESWIKGIEAIPGNRPIWLTEWGCLNDSNPDAATVQAFYSGAVAMFAKHPRLERYAWYPWTTNNELVDASVLTSLGTAFAAEASSR
jgi:Glycosyl hydrolase catalytic core